MRPFFSATYYFWIVSRIIFIIAGFINVLGIFSSKTQNINSLMINVLVVVYFLMLITAIVQDFAGIQNRLLRQVLGTCSLLIAACLLYIVFLMGKHGARIYPGAAIFFCAWLTGLGLFDLLYIRKATAKVYVDEDGIVP